MQLLSSDKSQNNELTENIKILATNDEKIKSFGEILTNDSSREILQLLFNDDLSATQIAQKSDISLQLVKYHLNKLRSLGIVKISKIEKNSKSQDMKIYTASKFSIVIVPPKLSAKTKESKLLIRSFRNIYKVVGLGVATGFSGLLSLLQVQDNNQQQKVATDDFASGGDRLLAIENSEPSLASSRSASFAKSDESAASSFPMDSDSASYMESDMPVDSAMEYSDAAVNTVVPSDELLAAAAATTTTSDLLTSLMMMATIVFGGLTAYYLYKFFKKSK